ncbi:MAG: hypothetical protein JWP91_1306 [Fibrobacteres bacterium]|nr:hypothetical protein [Fibrobacterota bacterium]
MDSKSTLRHSAAAFAIILSGLATGPSAVKAQTELDVWPMGVNGPQAWPPDLHNPWWDAEHKYPEGGQPPPVDLFDRIKCPGGSKVRIKSANSAPWENSRWHPPEYAFDGYTMSRWSSNGSVDKWLAADMGEAKAVNRVYLVWETAYGKDYDIQLSNDSVAWTTAKQVRGGNGQADVADLEGKGRYIRMMGVATGSPYGYSLYEFTICAAEGSSGLRNGTREQGVPSPRSAGSRRILKMTAEGLPQGLAVRDLAGRETIPKANRSGLGAIIQARP